MHVVPKKVRSSQEDQDPYQILSSNQIQQGTEKVGWMLNMNFRDKSSRKISQGWTL